MASRTPTWTRQPHKTIPPTPDRLPALALAAELLAQNKLVIKVQTFPFGRAAEAYRISQSGHVRGKLVLVP